MNPHTSSADCHTNAFPAFAKGFCELLQGERALDRTRSTIGLFAWCTKQHVQSISDDLGKGAFR